MPSKNDITGDQIKSKILSAKGRENWDRIFCKKSAYEWIDELYPNTVVYDPDGFRYNDGVTMNTPISRNDFQRRFNECTVMGLVSLKFN